MFEVLSERVIDGGKRFGPAKITVGFSRPEHDLASPGPTLAFAAKMGPRDYVTLPAGELSIGDRITTRWGDLYRVTHLQPRGKKSVRIEAELAEKKNTIDVGARPSPTFDKVVPRARGLSVMPKETRWKEFRTEVWTPGAGTVREWAAKFLSYTEDPAHPRAQDETDRALAWIEETIARTGFTLEAESADSYARQFRQAVKAATEATNRALEHLNGNMREADGGIYPKDPQRWARVSSDEATQALHFGHKARLPSDAQKSLSEWEKERVSLLAAAKRASTHFELVRAGHPKNFFPTIEAALVFLRAKNPDVDVREISPSYGAFREWRVYPMDDRIREVTDWDNGHGKISPKRLKPFGAAGELPFIAVNAAGVRMPVASLESAAQMWNAMRDAFGSGVSEIGNGVRVETPDGTVVGRVSYNGRIWKGDEEIPVGGESTPVKRVDNPTSTVKEGSVYRFTNHKGTVVADGFVQGEAELLVGAEGLAALRSAEESASKGRRLSIAEPVKGHVLVYPPDTDWSKPFTDRPTMNVAIAGKLIDLAEHDPAETFSKGDRARFTGKTDMILGGLFYEILEGPEKGKKKWTQTGPVPKWLPSEAVYKKAIAKRPTAAPVARERIPLESLPRAPLAELPRKAIIPTLEAEFRRGGASVPPIVVSKDVSGRLVVEDGRHRLEAARRAGIHLVPALVVAEGSVKGELHELLDVFRRSWGETGKANARHLVSLLEGHPHLAAEIPREVKAKIARSWIGQKIAELVRESKPRKQAIATAFAMARAKGILKGKKP